MAEEKSQKEPEDPHRIGADEPTEETESEVVAYLTRRDETPTGKSFTLALAASLVSVLLLGVIVIVVASYAQSCRAW